ncbi:hypothetical protein SAEN111111_05200 [Saccharibacillus endophyticus]
MNNEEPIAGFKHWLKHVLGVGDHVTISGNS